MSTFHIHIGRAKTGTTSIQNACHGNRELLLEQGYLYPKAAGWANHVPMVCAFSNRRNLERYADLGITDPAKRRAFAEKLKADFAEEISSAPAGIDVVTSSEHYAPALDEDAIVAMKEFSDQLFDSAQIIFYSRNPVDWLVSFYQTEVRNGRTAPFSPQTDIDRRRDMDLVRPWMDVFGEDAVKVRFFSRETLLNGDIVDDFMSLIGADPIGLVRDYHENRTLDARGLELLRSLNVRYPELLRDAKQVRKALIRRLEATSGHHRAMISRETADALYSARSEDIAWLSERTGVPVETIKRTSRIAAEDDDLRHVNLSPDDMLDMIVATLPEIVRPAKGTKRG